MNTINNCCKFYGYFNESSCSVHKDETNNKSDLFYMCVNCSKSIESYGMCNDCSRAYGLGLKCKLEDKPDRSWSDPPRTEEERLRQELFIVTDDRDHLDLYLHEMVALILHRDFRAKVSLNPGSLDLIKAMKRIEELQKIELDLLIG